MSKYLDLIPIAYEVTKRILAMEAWRVQDMDENESIHCRMWFQGLYGSLTIIRYLSNSLVYINDILRGNGCNITHPLYLE
jgi:hypothetical protein